MFLALGYHARVERAARMGSVVHFVTLYAYAPDPFRPGEEREEKVTVTLLTRDYARAAHHAKNLLRASGAAFAVVFDAFDNTLVEFEVRWLGERPCVEMR